MAHKKVKEQFKTTDKKKFFELIDKAMRPHSPTSNEIKEQNESVDYTDTKTHQHTSGDTSGKQRGKSHQ